MLTVAGILEILSQILVHKIRSHMVLGVKVGSDEKSKNTDSFVSNKGVSYYIWSISGLNIQCFDLITAMGSDSISLLY